MTKTALKEALHAEVDTAEPDFDRLVAGATRQGTRIRNVRRGGIALGAVAVVGVVGAVGAGSSLLGGAPTPSEAPGFAPASPSDATSPAVPLRVPAPQDGRTLSPAQKSTISQRVGRVIQREVPGTGAYLINFETASIRFGQTITDQQHRALGAALPGWHIARSGGAAPATGLVDEIPVTVAAAGWSCEWYLVDDKAACTESDGGVAGLVIRSASEHDAWTSSPDKGAGPGVHVSEIHGDIFITVQGGQGTTNAEIQELGASLRWN